jgi:hypothetical protein
MCTQLLGKYFKHKIIKMYLTDIFNCTWWNPGYDIEVKSCLYNPSEKDVKLGCAHKNK